MLSRQAQRTVSVVSRLTLVLGLLVLGAGCSSAPILMVQLSGNRLVNGEGKAIRLLGVNRSGAEYACLQGRGFFDGPTGKQAIAAMRSWRINAVRIPLNEDCWLGINGAPRRYSGARYRGAIRGYVARLNKAGLYVILDLHWNAPGGERSTGQQPMADLDHAAAFWSSVARAFKTDPAILFDLYNEPHGISWQCWLDGCVLPEGWRTAGVQAMVDAVRSTGARQPIIVSGPDWGNDLASWLRYRPHDPARQLVAGFHVYNWLSCSTVACWNHTVRPVARSVPVIATEFGARPCTTSFAVNFMNWADAAGVSYLGWTWNPWACNTPALITSWDGQPSGYGQALREHLRELHLEGGQGSSP